MAKYLKPLRGKFSSATQQDILLRKGEMFLCLLNNDNMGQGPGAIYLGDGISAFNGYNHNGSTVANTAQPFLIHPAKYKPIFANSNPSTASWTIDAATSEINNIGNGKALVELPTVIGNIKAALCKHADSITKLTNDRDDILNTLDDHARQLSDHSNKITDLTNKINDTYRVGSIYITVDPNVNPGTLFGGTWTRLSAGYVLKTIGSGTGGSTAAATNCSTTTLTTAQIPNHKHGISAYSTSITVGNHAHEVSAYNTTITVGNHTHNVPAKTALTTESGGTQPKYAYVAAGGQGDAHLGTDMAHWEWENCKTGSGGDPAGGPHTHKFTVPANTAEDGGSFSKPISFAKKNTENAGSFSKEISFGAKDTNASTGGGGGHTHTTGMPQSIGVHVWKRVS